MELNLKFNRRVHMSRLRLGVGNRIRNKVIVKNKFGIVALSVVLSQDHCQQAHSNVHTVLSLAEVSGSVVNVK